MMIISSRDNPRIKDAVNLASSKKARLEQRRFIGEGFTLLEEALNAGVAETVFCLQGMEEKLPPVNNAEVISVTPNVMDKLSSVNAPPGVVFICKMSETQMPELPAIAVENLSDPGNMGAILRTANAAGYRQVYLTEDCTDPYSPKSVRASMSGLFFVKVYSAPREELLKTLKNTPILVADMRGENLFSFLAPERYALVIGNEGNGVSETVKAASAHTVSIPMQGSQESLNASVAAGIAMYLLSKKDFQNE